MHNEDKRQSPYRGFWITMILLILPPIIGYSLLTALLNEFSVWPEALDAATAKALGCGLGFLFHMICLLSGVLTSGWEAIKYRIGEFFENLVVGLGYAFKTYFEDMCDDGVTFVIYGSVILTNFLLMADGIRQAVILLSAM